jgi:hypothetical protein
MLAIIYGPSLYAGILLTEGDGLGYYFPMRVLAAQSLWHGELPFWNPGDYAGVPLHAMLQTGVFYPGNFAFLFLPSVAAMNATVLLGSWIAGVSMYAFGRALSLARVSSLAMAIPFMLAGYSVAHLEQVTSVQVVGLIPAVLWTLERYRQTLDVRFAWAFLGVFLLQLLAGYPQSSLLTLVIAGCYALHRAKGLTRAQCVPYFGHLFVATTLAFGLAAVQLLPAVDVLAQSNRLDQGYAEITKHSFPPRQLPSLAFPYLFGGAAGPFYRVPYWGAGTYYIELYGYIGLVTLTLALLALLDVLRNARVRFWAIVCLVGLLLAFGSNTPIYTVWAKLPVLHSIRVPGRHLMEVDLALAVLAGFGLQALLDADVAARWRKLRVVLGGLGLAMGLLLAIAGFAGARIVAHLSPWNPALASSHPLTLTQPAFWVQVLLFMAMAGALAAIARRPERARLAMLLAVVLLDMWTYSLGQNWRVVGPYPRPTDALVPPYPLVNPYRAIQVTWGNPCHNYELSRALRFPNLGVLWDQRSAAGNEAFHMARNLKIMGTMEEWSKRDLFTPAHHGLDLLGVRTLRLDKLSDDPAWQALLQPPRWHLISDEPLVRVYENAHALPRAWRPATAKVLESALIDRMLTNDPQFDPSAVALLEAGPVVGQLTPGSARAWSLSLNRIAVETSGTGPGLVLVNEAFDAGWRAWRDNGNELPLRRADGLIMGIKVPAGPCRLTLVYAPPLWRWCLVISGTTLLLALLWMGWTRRGQPIPLASPALGV